MEYTLKELRKQLVDLKDDRRELNSKHNHIATTKEVMDNLYDVQSVQARVALLEKASP